MIDPLGSNENIQIFLNGMTQLCTNGAVTANGIECTVPPGVGAGFFSLSLISEFFSGKISFTLCGVTNFLNFSYARKIFFQSCINIL